MKTSTLTITRYTVGRELLESGKWAAASASTSIPIDCSIQPFQGIKQVKLPEGLTASDARVVYTTTKLQTSSQFTKIQADETLIDGLTYECFEVQDWNQFSLATDHYLAVFIRKDEDV
jgi:hypothetical protein